MVTDKLSICIVGKDTEGHLAICIDLASKICRKIFYVDLEPDDEARSKAIELGARVVDLDSLPSALQAEWVLFIKPEERPVVSSAKMLQKIMRNRQVQGYGIYTNSTKARHLLENYQWIMKLDQFKNTENVAYVAKIEPRLVQKSLAEACLRALASNNTEEISWICGRIAEGIAIESILNEEPDKEESAQDHDIRCLTGELTYDATPADDMVELSEAYTGFRIVHKDQLEGFLAGAQSGFGHIKIYIPFLDFLCKEGFFEEARNLFEQWIEHRPDDKRHYNSQLMGGMIYSNLLELDRAIEWFKRIIEKSKNSLTLANLGKLYLIKGEKEVAVDYLKRSEDMQGDIFLKKRILSVIDNKDWRPLKLSLCMIVRDEETQIGKALESVKDIVDEVVVVDTGSSDKTREIVREYGGKVFETEWKNDFSKAKNVALEQATGDYILFMDADEFIDTRHKFALALFKKLLPTEKSIAFGIKVESAKESKSMSMSILDMLSKSDESSYQIRLFPRRSEIQFQGKVFESLDESLIKTQVKALRNDLVKITHSMEGREQRDKRKIPAIAKSFDSIQVPQKILEAGILLLRLGELDNALPWLMRVQNMDPQLFSKIGMLYSSRNKPDMAKEILARAFERYSESSEITLTLAELYHKERNYDELINILGKQIKTIDKSLESEDAAAARYYLGIASIEIGNLADGIEYLAFAHEKDPANILYKIAGIYAFAKVDQWEEALQVAAQIADEEGIDIPGEVNDFVDVGRIFVEMNRHFAEEGRVEESNLCQKIVEDVIKTKITGEENIQRMSAVIEGMG